MSNVNNISIFDYDDYRQFISDHFTELKTQFKQVSLATISKKAGLSRMGVKYVMDKKRHLTEESATRFAHAMNLHGAEREFFECLVRFNKAKTTTEKSACFVDILKIKGSPLKERMMEHGDMPFYKEWYYPVIAELSYLKGFRNDPSWIRRQLFFRVNELDIASALEYLGQNGFLKGSTSAPRKVKVPDGFKSMIFKQFVLKMIELSREAVDRQSTSEREIFNITISVDAAKFQLAKKMIAEFRHKLHDTLANTDECERVVQINMQMITLAGGQKGELS